MPTHIWKVLYSPKQQRAGAYLITNDATREYSAVTVSDLEKLVGIKLLPGLSQQVRDSGMDLPKPSSKKSRSKKGQPADVGAGAGAGTEEEFTLKDFSRSILDAIGRAIK